MNDLDFLDLYDEQSGFDDSKFVILPIPYEATTTYQKGTDRKSVV